MPNKNPAPNGFRNHWLISVYIYIYIYLVHFLLTAESTNWHHVLAWILCTMENLYLIIAFCGLPDNKSNAITAQPRCLLLIIMQCKKSFRTRLYREKLSRERGTFSHPSQLSECLYDKKKDPFAWANSWQQCSRMLRLSRLDRVDPTGWIKVFIWRKVGPARRVTLPPKKGESSFLFLM